MYVEHSGWNKENGPFSYKVFFDEKRTDYEIHYKNGMVYKQDTAFEDYTYDWNNDGDVYTQFGAFFKCYNKDGEYERRGIFMTPVDMVFALIEGMDEYKRQRENVVVAIPGINLPEKDNRPNIEDQIHKNERRSMAQEIERNRKRSILGIRDPGEPWLK